MSTLFCTMHRTSFWKQICKILKQSCCQCIQIQRRDDVLSKHAMYSVFSLSHGHSQITTANSHDHVKIPQLYIRIYGDLLIRTWFFSRALAELRCNFSTLERRCSSLPAPPVDVAYACWHPTPCSSPLLLAAWCVVTVEQITHKIHTFK
jgi:hypothetical protein